MTRNLYMVVLVSCITLVIQATDTRKLFDAITETEEDTFAALYKEAELDEDEKRILKKEAEEVITTRKNDVSLLKSPRDLALALLGFTYGSAAFIGAVWGGIIFLEGTYEIGALTVLACTLVGGHGFYQGIGGLLCKHAYSRVTAARRILDVITQDMGKKNKKGEKKKKKNQQ